jgi:hypothetical protein
MTTVTLDELLDLDDPVGRDPVARVRAQAREVHAGASVLLFVVTLLMWVGRVPAYLVNATVWTFLAVREGYRDVRPPPVRAEQGARAPMAARVGR